MVCTNLNIKSAIADLLPRDVELEGGVEDGVQVALVDGGLLLLHTLVSKHQPDLDVRI